jgi:hypothetical protein
MARAWEQRQQLSEARLLATTALMDAAEHLLYELRRHLHQDTGRSRRHESRLVHYYFGSMDELLTQTPQRFVDQLADALEEL